MVISQMVILKTTNVHLQLLSRPVTITKVGVQNIQAYLNDAGMVVEDDH